MNPFEHEIPVTLVTGFLGSGKTTLVNHILRTQTEQQFAVIENEFGMMGVDGSFVDAPKESVFEINDGCVCCSVQGDLLEVFRELVSRNSEFDHVIIETTGLADPAPVMRLFERSEIGEHFDLVGVVTVVDAHHLKASLEEVETCEEQITYSDVLVVNKIDGLSRENLEVTEARLRTLNPFAQILRAEHAKVEAGLVLFPSRRPVDELQLGNTDHGTHQHRHDQAIVSVAVEASGHVDIERLDAWLFSLTRRNDLSLLRMKGLLSIPNHPQRFIFHGVRDAIDVRPDRSWGVIPRTNRIVFIGRRLDEVALQEAFMKCIKTESMDMVG